MFIKIINQKLLYFQSTLNYYLEIEHYDLKHIGLFWTTLHFIKDWNIKLFNPSFEKITQHAMIHLLYSRTSFHCVGNYQSETYSIQDEPFCYIHIQTMCLIGVNVGGLLS